MKKMTAIIVGLGRQSLSDHIPTLLRRKDIDIIGVCDPSINARKAFKETFPALERIHMTNSLDDLLSKAHPDFAIVAVPHNKYFEIASRLCSSKIHFLKEKPLARDLTEARDLLALPGFAQYGFITTQRRYSSLYRKAKDSIASIGDPYLFHAVYKLNIDAPDDGWRGNKASAGGGCLIDMGYHLIDQLLWWFGMPEKVHAQISALAVPNSEYDAEDSATISFRFTTGLHGTLLISRAAGEKREEYEVYGSKGYLIGSKKGFTVSDRQGQSINEMMQDNGDSMLDAQLDFFLSRVSERQGFKDVQQNHLADMEFINRCYQDALEEESKTPAAAQLRTELDTASVNIA